MRLRRVVVVITVALSALFVTSSPASAQIEQLTVGQPVLGPIGASVSVPLTFTCDPQFNVAFADVFVQQATGHKLTQGSGSFFNDFPGVPCTGSPQTVTVQASAFGPFTFKQGKAVVSASLTVFDPIAFSFSTESVTTQAVRITK